MLAEQVYSDERLATYGSSSFFDTDSRFRGVWSL